MMIYNMTSDQLFLIFIVLLVISVLFITSGVGVVLPQRYNTWKVFEKNPSDSHKKARIWNYILSILLLMTMVIFLMFFYKEFIV